MATDKPLSVLHRTIVVPLVRDDAGAYLLCKMPPDRGVFPGQWGLPGGGIEPGERMEDALRREVHEELGIEIRAIRRLTFKDGSGVKTFADGSRCPIYMIFLLFECRAVTKDLSLNDEFCDHAWVAPERLGDYDLNTATVDTFRELGLLTPA